MHLKLFIFLTILICSSCTNSFKLISNGGSTQKAKFGKKEMNHDCAINVTHEISLSEHADSVSFPTKSEILNENDKSIKKTILSSLTLNRRIQANVHNNSVKTLVPNTSVLSQKSPEIHGQKTSENFWGDLIKDFFLTLLIGIIVIFIVVSIIVYGGPLLIHWILISLGILAALFILILFITWIVLKIEGEI